MKFIKMRTLYSQISKSIISKLPQVTFAGKIIVVQSLHEAQRAIDVLSKEKAVGIDTETKPAFRKGKLNKVALLQVSTFDICFLFRLNLIGLCEPVIQFLGDDNILKVGLSLHDDILALHRRDNFDSKKFLDLQSYVPQFGIKDMSLQKIYANVFKRRISKAQRLSNWEADVLSDSQKAYAATDAWACLMLFSELEKLRKTHDYVIIKADEIQETDS